MFIKSSNGKIEPQKCHRCGVVRKQDYLHLAEVAPDNIQFVCDDCPPKIEFDDGTAAPLVRGTIPAGVHLAAITSLALFFSLGMFMAAIFIAPDFLEVAGRWWGIK